ncbi:MAG: hypothetical protein ACK4NC_06890 [Candidatus Gracilibacteria bacterium]
MKSFQKDLIDNVLPNEILSLSEEKPRRAALVPYTKKRREAFIAFTTALHDGSVNGEHFAQLFNVASATIARWKGTKLKMVSKGLQEKISNIFKKILEVYDFDEERLVVLEKNLEIFDDEVKVSKVKAPRLKKSDPILDSKSENAKEELPKESSDAKKTRKPLLSLARAEMLCRLTVLFGATKKNWKAVGCPISYDSLRQTARDGLISEKVLNRVVEWLTDEVKKTNDPEIISLWDEFNGASTVADENLSDKVIDTAEKKSDTETNVTAKKSEAVDDVQPVKGHEKLLAQVGDAESIYNLLLSQKETFEKERDEYFSMIEQSGMNIEFVEKAILRSKLLRVFDESSEPRIISEILLTKIQSKGWLSVEENDMPLYMHPSDYQFYTYFKEKLKYEVVNDEANCITQLRFII